MANIEPLLMDGQLFAYPLRLLWQEKIWHVFIYCSPYNVRVYLCRKMEKTEKKIWRWINLYKAVSVKRNWGMFDRKYFYHMANFSMFSIVTQTDTELSDGKFE